MSRAGGAPAAVRDGEPESPWAALADLGRLLTALAEQLRDVPPAELAPGRGPVTVRCGDGREVTLDDALRELVCAAQEAPSLAAACRAAVWTRLRTGDRRLTLAQIGAMWGVSKAAIGNAITRSRASWRPPR